jgi:hypothetical protein
MTNQDFGQKWEIWVMSKSDDVTDPVPILNITFPSLL